MMAKEIQNPPYEDSAVAPKVFPIAISLSRHEHSERTAVYTSTKQFDLPHACEQLNKPTITESQRNDDTRNAKVADLQVDQAEDESCQCKG